jgi:hypothetical protein
MSAVIKKINRQINPVIMDRIEPTNEVMAAAS